MYVQKYFKRVKNNFKHEASIGDADLMTRLIFNFPLRPRLIESAPLSLFFFQPPLPPQPTLICIAENGKLRVNKPLRALPITFYPARFPG